MAEWPDLEALKRATGITSDDAGRDGDMQLALDAAIEQTQLDCAISTMAPTSSQSRAALILAVLLWKATDAPYGIAGVFDTTAVQIAADHPTYQRALAGQRGQISNCLMAVAIAPPWLQLPDIDGANIYRVPPTGAIQVPAIVYRPDEPWIDRQQTYKAWVENYVAVCVVAQSSGSDGVLRLYEMALAIKEAADADRAWEWKGAGGIVETEQAGFTYLACAVRLSFRAEY